MAPRMVEVAGENQPESRNSGLHRMCSLAESLEPVRFQVLTSKGDAMKRLFIAAALITISLAHAGGTSEVLLFMRSGSADLEFMLKKEVMVMKGTLEQSGYKVVVATLDGSDFSAGSVTVKADIRLAEAEVDDYAGFILPCMMVASYPRRQ